VQSFLRAETGDRLNVAQKDHKCMTLNDL